MTDRDLYMCGDFNCDGHARSNERCVDPESGYPVGPAAPTYTVSGNSMRIFRLDPEGNPIGEAMEFPGPVSFDIPEGTVEDATVLMDSDGFSSLTLDIDMGQVSPEVMALLTGQGTPPEKIEVFIPRPWYWRWLPRRVRHWVKGREVRRGYGG